MKILIGDSGSTKTDWAYLYENEVKYFTTQGLNPNYLSTTDIQSILVQQTLSNVEHPPEHLFFYGAGLNNIHSKSLMYAVFEKVFPHSQLSIEHDLLGAARAVYGLCESGIICILGTGSIAGFYDGERIPKTMGGLGYLLGDEGSGTHLGKMLIAQYAQKQLPRQIENALYEQIQIKTNDILHFLYQQKYPNRFLAQLTHFIAMYRENEAIQDIVRRSFQSFCEQTLLPLANQCFQRLKIRCVGSIAHIFEQEWKAVLLKNGMKVDKIMRKPISGLVEHVRHWVKS
ncbi:MAG: hypothetical protein NZ455_10965 [Bacteroidia bacterium]|nr:hypothetical protein [Bacteroidia bacterium]MDW8348472.1 hypothetical protein [Bacteroidia bacterium]